MTSKEALETLKKRMFGYGDLASLYDTEYGDVVIEKYTKCFEVIEKELKRLDKLDNGAYVSIHINRYNELCDKEKALEIIKEHGLISSFFIYNNTYETYQVNLSFYDDVKLMTKEEYNLLREVCYESNND